MVLGGGVRGGGGPTGSDCEILPKRMCQEPAGGTASQQPSGEGRSATILPDRDGPETGAVGGEESQREYSLLLPGKHVHKKDPVTAKLARFYTEWRLPSQLKCPRLILMPCLARRTCGASSPNCILHNAMEKVVEGMCCDEALAPVPAPSVAMGGLHAPLAAMNAVTRRPSRVWWSAERPTPCRFGSRGKPRMRAPAPPHTRKFGSKRRTF